MNHIPKPLSKSDRLLLHEERVEECLNDIAGTVRIAALAHTVLLAAIVVFLFLILGAIR